MYFLIIIALKIKTDILTLVQVSVRDTSRSSIEESGGTGTVQGALS